MGLKPAPRPKFFYYVLIFLLIIVGLALFVTQPSLKEGSSSPKPVINLGIDRCEKCGMVITDERFASAYWSEEEKRWRLFDDIGCMIKDMREAGNTGARLVYVSDYLTGELIEAREAYFVVADPAALTTPMGYGVVALRSREDALRLVDRVGGRVMGFEELLRSWGGG